VKPDLPDVALRPELEPTVRTGADMVIRRDRDDALPLALRERPLVGVPRDEETPNEIDQVPVRASSSVHV
jgi:hypothetical protein